MADGNLPAVHRVRERKNMRLLNAYDDNRQELGGGIARPVASACAIMRLIIRL